MASISKQPGGRRTVQFVAADGRRRSIRLGKVSQRTAESIQTRVEILNAAKIAGHAVDGDTAQWLAEREPAILDKLAAVGLIPRRASAALGAFLDSYIDSRCDVKPATKRKYQSTRKSLVRFFEGNKPLREVTPGDADDWRRGFVQREKAENTIRKHTAVAKLFFGAAVKKGLIGSNPFSHLKATIMPNRERFYFVTREETQKVLNACPDAEWRLIVVLARYAGFRCPSEHFGLRWRDIDWERGRIKVTSPKTAHHPGGESRVIPLFPEVRPALAEAFDLAEEGAEYVLGERYRHNTTNLNLRSRLLDIIRAAGLKEWPKLFQNMRSSRETELAESFPMHVVCAWIGNSEPIAAKHYLQVTDDHFALATEALRNPVQSAHATGRTVPQADKQEGVFAEECRPLRYCTTVDMAEAGLEPDSVTPCGQRDLGKSPGPRAAKSGAVDARELPLDPDLAVVVEVWPTLPEATRQAVLRIVREARS